MINNVAMADIMSAIFVLVSLVCQLTDWNQGKRSIALRECSALTFLWCSVDALSYYVNEITLSIGMLWFLLLIVYLMGPIVYITFVRYCYFYIIERTSVTKWFYILPIGLAFLVESITLVCFFSGKLIIFEKGSFINVGRVPDIVLIVNTCLLLYLPLAAALKGKVIGLKAVSLLGLYGVAPMLSLVVLILTGHDYSVAMTAVAVIMVVSFLQRDETRKKMEEILLLNEQLEAAKLEAETANRAKTAFLFNMSHDIRTPMNAITGFRTLLEKYQEDPVKRDVYLKKIEDASNILLSIINNVLEMARIENGSVELEETACTVYGFNDTLFSIFDDMMIEKGIQFTRRLDIEHQYVFCDTSKLREVFNNVLSNAYKYTNSGGKVDMYLEELPCEKEGYGLYRTWISDTGIGMSAEFLPHLFDEFSREKSTTDAKIEGTGLGMPIVKKLVELMEGTIQVTSQKGEGTTFVISLPHRIARETDLEEAVSTKTDCSLFQGKRILLVEDNDLNAEIAMEVLGELGFVLERAEDGAVCLEKIKCAGADDYDLILMDIQMPNMNGYQAAKAIRSLADPVKSRIKILAMTANAFEEDRQEAFSCGMNGHLAKPINVNELMKTLASLLH